MKELTNQIISLLRKDFRYFFRHAIEHLVQEDTGFNQTMYVFSIQQALELLVKIYVANHYGVLVVLDFEQTHDVRLREKSEQELLNLLNNNKLKTRDYNKLLEIFKTDADLNKQEKTILSRFQQMRNQIVHMGINSFSSSIASEVNRLVASIFNKLEFKEQVGDKADMDNTLLQLLGEDLFKKYLSTTSIANDTETFISNNYDSKSIYCCLECLHKTVVYDSYAGEYRCYLCGYQLHDDYVGVLQCPECSSNNFYFDTLNISETNPLDGSCPVCGAHFEVAKCGECGDFYFPCISKCSCQTL